MKKLTSLIAFLLYTTILMAQQTATPDQIYGQLFKTVQLNKVLPDGKTFVDCVPKTSPAIILKEFAKQNPKGPALKLFVEKYFDIPQAPQVNLSAQEKDVVVHIKSLWNVLKRDADPSIEGSSLLPLPHPYIVPGGRFREIYYWDSYFTMLGLKASGEHVLIENMIKNFSYLIDTYGHIPNGNRSYYISRSQPPFFSMMVELLAEIQGDAVYAKYLPQLEKEYHYWMEGSKSIKPGSSFKRVVSLNDGALLNRYWDDNATPRQESYKEDVETAQKSRRTLPEMYHHLRAGAASGWDFSSRWFKDDKTLVTIQTTDILPVDLNSLIYKLEMILSRAYLISNKPLESQQFEEKADRRKSAIMKYCWNNELKFFTDFNFISNKKMKMITAAGMFPFCVFEGQNDYMSLLARNAAEQVRAKLLQPGGIVTTPNRTGQQWDAPNGWAPLQWMAIKGLNRCGQRELARDIAQRWIKINIDVYKRTGKLMEKYNVMDLGLDAGGGEYPSQDGFGWTNGVLLALLQEYR